MVRSAELARLGKNADAGHIAREAAEAATLKRCNSCDDGKEKPVEEPLVDWESVMDSIKNAAKNHKRELAITGTVIVVGGAIILAPETGGASLGALAAF